MKNNNVMRLSNSIRRLNKAEDKRRLKTMERFWVQDTSKLHAFNYWYYRWFTNEFELYILDAIKFKEIKKNEYKKHSSRKKKK